MNPLNVSLLSVVTHSNAKVDMFFALIIGTARLKRVATSASACKLVFKDQGWLILHYEEEGELEDLRMSQPYSHSYNPLRQCTCSKYS